MRKEYDFANMKGRKNPYAQRLKQQVTLRLGVDVIEYFKALAEEILRAYVNARFSTDEDFRRRVRKLEDLEAFRPEK